MTGYRYWVLEWHHQMPQREFLNLGVLVAPFPRSSQESSLVQIVEADDPQGVLVLAKGERGRAALNAVDGWSDQFITMTEDEIDAFRERSYMSSLLLSPPGASVGDSAHEVLDRLFPLFCDPTHPRAL